MKIGLLEERSVASLEGLDREIEDLFLRSELLSREERFPDSIEGISIVLRKVGFSKECTESSTLVAKEFDNIYKGWGYLHEIVLKTS